MDNMYLITQYMNGGSYLISVSAILLTLITFPIMFIIIGNLEYELQYEMADYRQFADDIWVDIMIQRKPFQERIRRQILDSEVRDDTPSFKRPTCSNGHEPHTSADGTYTQCLEAPCPAEHKCAYVPEIPFILVCCPTPSFPPLGIHSPVACDCAARPNFCPAGRPGPPGPAGMDGEPGVPGNPGKKGIRGDLVFPPVDVCPSCPRGPPGPPGRNGRPGVPGKRGEPGRRGPPSDHVATQGPQGPPGDSGVAGHPGAPGAAGPVGKDGFKSRGKGIPGPKGTMGKTGPPGYSGAMGPNGTPGAPGEIGLPGLQGPIGHAGYPGLKGLAGRSGEPGTDAGYCRCPERTAFHTESSDFYRFMQQLLNKR